MATVAPIQMITGSVAPPGMEEACAELDEKNKTERRKTVDKLNRRKKKQGKLSESHQETLDKASGTGMTFSSAQSTIPGAPGSFCASSSGVAQECNPSLTPGGTSEQKVGQKKKIRNSKDKRYDKRKKESGILCDNRHVHPGGGKGAHAEPKIFNDLTNKAGASSMRGGTVLLNIDWRFKRGGKADQSGMPCRTCYDMLCKAARECDIKILICAEDNKPTKIAKEDCNEDGAYESLSNRVDGSDKPGRNAAKAAAKAAKAF